MTKKYNHIVLGGTFDHFHIGHEKIIKKAVELSDCITVGLAIDDLYKHKLFADGIEPYEIRKEVIELYFLELGYVGSLEIIPIFDIYGTTLKDSTFDAIIVTEETLHNANVINERRVNKKFRMLEIVMVPFEKGKSGNKITSELIRTGQIDRSGNAYLDLFNTDLILPQALRKELRKPLGQVYEGEEDNLKLAATALKKDLTRNNKQLLISVGDISTLSLQAVGVRPDIAVIDNRSQRHDLKDKHVTNDNVVNRSGTISKNAVSELYKYIADVTENKRSLTLEIQGEEDLLALPAILLSPLSTRVVYGQYDLGLVAILVTEEKKDQVKSILSRF